MKVTEGKDCLYFPLMLHSYLSVLLMALTKVLMRKPRWMLVAWLVVLGPAGSLGPVALGSLMLSGLHWPESAPKILGTILSWAIAGRHEVFAKLFWNWRLEFLYPLKRVSVRG